MLSILKMVGTPDPTLPPEYLRSEGFEKAVNEDLYSILGGFKTDSYDSHYYTGKVLDQGATDQQLRKFSSEYHPKKFLNAAAYAKAMNELAVDAGGKNVSNIPFADNSMLMRTSDDDIEYKKYYTPRTIVEKGKFNPKTLNAIQLKANPAGMEMQEGGELPKAKDGKNILTNLLFNTANKITPEQLQLGMRVGDFLFPNTIRNLGKQAFYAADGRENFNLRDLKHELSKGLSNQIWQPGQSFAEGTKWKGP